VLCTHESRAHVYTRTGNIEFAGGADSSSVKDSGGLAKAAELLGLDAAVMKNVRHHDSTLLLAPTENSKCRSACIDVFLFLLFINIIRIMQSNRVVLLLSLPPPPPLTGVYRVQDGHAWRDHRQAPQQGACVRRARCAQQADLRPSVWLDCAPGITRKRLLFVWHPRA
jgi:hypothetical protein